ncbi:hypothetical protein IC221_16670 [Flammeovirga sp. EKP202]|nr:hypothetical protein [Flammeovirga sp. EKP202]
MQIKAFAQYNNPANRYDKAYEQYLDATCPLQKDSIKHFVYFSRDRELIHNHPLLDNKRLVGAQIMYSWRQLEPKKGTYNFSIIYEDYAYLTSHGKKLFIQLQDVSFSATYKAVPDYLLTEEYDDGCIALNEEDGWAAKRWNRKVQNRWIQLLHALGKEFNGKIEGINFQETAAGTNNTKDSSFSPERYVKCIKENMKALKQAFPNSVTMQYANFMPGEWLPWDDKGYLRAIYQYGNEIGVGLGGPDLMVQRKGQLNHLIAMMHEYEYKVPLGIAIQDGNYIGKTGADKDYNEHKDKGLNQQENIVPLLHAFAKDFLNVNYMFWVNQEPYFRENVIPCMNN